MSVGGRVSIPAVGLLGKDRWMVSRTCSTPFVRRSGALASEPRAHPRGSLASWPVCGFGDLPLPRERSPAGRVGAIDDEPDEPGVVAAVDVSGREAIHLLQGARHPAEADE